jgi:catechol 2,3-dioxygenase-like lactoylglutathione lyase family enzyme
MVERGERTLVHKVDCVRFYVPDPEAGLAYYRDRLGHRLVWRTVDAAGLAMPGSDAEIVLQRKSREQEVDFGVASADDAAVRVEAAGDRVVVQPFDIQIGRCVVVEDPWGNRMVLLDSTAGLLETDGEGNVIGNAAP